MTVEQIYNTLNSVASQVYGSAAVAVTDTSTFYSLGTTVMGGSPDNFLNVLVDRIGKTVLRTLDYESAFPGLLRNEFEFGAVLQKINIQPMAAKAQEAWNISDPSWNNTIWDIDPPTISQTFFRDSAAWEVDLTVPDSLLKTAFTSEAAMDSFISGVFATMDTSLRIQIDIVTRAAVCGLMAEKIDAGYNVIDLLTLYNSGHTPTLTAAEALESPAFLRYAGKIMRDGIDYLREPSILYNEGGMVRATSRDNLVCCLSQPLESAYNSYLSSDVFHNELIALPYYNPVRVWQGSGVTAQPNVVDVTSVKVKVKSGNTVEIPYVMGLFMDREAVAIGFMDRFTAADRNNRNRFTNYTEGITIQHMVDLSENAIIYTLGQPTITP